MKVCSASPIIHLRRDFSFVIKYYNEKGFKIGYSTASLKDLDEMKNQKMWCGKKVSFCEISNLSVAGSTKRWEVK